MLRNAKRELDRRRRLQNHALRAVGACCFLSHIWRRHVADAQLAVRPQYDEASRTHVAHGSGAPWELSLRQRADWRLRYLDDNTAAANNEVKSRWGIGDEPRPHKRNIGSAGQPIARKQPAVCHLAQTEPGTLLSRALHCGTKGDYWRREIAMARSLQLPIVLLQLLIRKGSLTLPESSELRELLPSDEELNQKAELVSRSDPAGRDLDDCVYVLQGRTDDERCERFLERNNPGPRYLFAFLLRPYANITKATTLYSLMEYCHTYFADQREPGTEPCDRITAERLEKSLSLSRDRLSHIMSLLMAHCLLVEPRFVVKLGAIAARFVERTATYPDASGKLYLVQCEVFNSALSLLQPRRGAHPIQKKCPNAYFWEAHRTLLAVSAGLEKPLQVGLEAFRSIRGVLAGQAKNHAETRSATRYAASWPPYLRPADGMDETTDPEDNWSRAVNAGVMMQEAGFAKEQRDDALDILQGMTKDGTPTIQQRITFVSQRRVEPWEASIRATRNAQEAWERFQNPPVPGLKPGAVQYSAMFEKLTLREADENSLLLPGDKALNFPTLGDANLTEFERARLRPPSVAQLYEQMRLSGIRPKGSCLQILVANAESLDTAHGYLRDSAERQAVIGSLTGDDVKPAQLRTVPMKLFEAYIQVCSRVDGRRGDRPLKRGMLLASLRLDAASSRWASVIWGPLLKALSQNRKVLKVSRSEQLRLFQHVMDRIDESSVATLPTFIQFAKCIRKVVRRELPELLIDLDTAEYAKRNRLGHFYALRTADQGTADTLIEAPYSLLKVAAERMKSIFNGLVAQERHNQGLPEMRQVAPLERMACRTDPVSSEHAYDYMVSLAFLGEFDEMAGTLRWLAKEWGQPDVVDAMQELDEPPPQANFFEPLCAFRLLAEPMLGEAMVVSLRQELEASAAGWVWPDEEAVAMFADTQQDDSIGTLRRVLNRVRHWQTAKQPTKVPEANRVEEALPEGRLPYKRRCMSPRGIDENGVSERDWLCH